MKKNAKRSDNSIKISFQLVLIYLNNRYPRIRSEQNLDSNHEDIFLSQQSLTSNLSRKKTRIIDLTDSKLIQNQLSIELDFSFSGILQKSKKSKRSRSIATQNIHILKDDIKRRERLLSLKEKELSFQKRLLKFEQEKRKNANN